MNVMDRRTFTKMAAAMGATAAFGDSFVAPSPIAWRERRELFPEGVASGDPDSHSVLLWTRCPQSERNRALHCNWRSRRISRSGV